MEPDGSAQVAVFVEFGDTGPGVPLDEQVTAFGELVADGMPVARSLVISSIQPRSRSE